MDVIITKIEPQTPEESNDMMREEIIEITSTPSIVMDGNLLERVEQPFLSQSERNLRQMIEDENLIFAVQKFPIIYDRTNPNYQNKEQVRYVWSVIAENSNRSRKYTNEMMSLFEDMCRGIYNQSYSDGPHITANEASPFHKMSDSGVYGTYNIHKVIFDFIWMKVVNRSHT